MKRALAFLLLCCAGSALAQRAALVDPTRPPSAASEPSTSTKESVPAGPRLQSILISPTRRVAVISGNTVVQGGQYGGAKVVAISEGTVLLRYADRKETLHLLPGVVKRARQTDSAAQSHKGISR